MKRAPKLPNENTTNGVRCIETADMNTLDLTILSFLNGFAQRFPAFDRFVSGVLDNNFVKAGIIAALLWWVWFQSDSREEERHEFVLSGIATGFLAVIIARLLALTLPFRERPLHNDALHFQLPYGVNERALFQWSSFPSDHAALFFALATTIFLASRFVGILAFIHVLFATCFTRVYLGFHYPSDILVGALIGVGSASLCNIASVRKELAKPGIRWLRGHPASFYASFFMVTLLISTIFDPLRDLVRFLFITVREALKF